MAGPWEKYQAPQTVKPWEKYAKAAAEAPAATTPDGRTVAPGTTADEAARIPEGMVYDPRTGGYADTAAQAQRMGKGAGAAASYMAGTPFIGESMDEIAGAVSSLGGANPEIEQERFRQSRKQFQESDPKTAMGLEIAGGVVGSAPLAAGGAGLVTRAGGGALGKGAAAAATAGTAGALEGASQGYGAGRGQGRVKGAQTGAAIGGGLGVALGPTAAALGYGAQELARRVKKLDLRVIADEFGISRKAARVVQRALREDDLDAAMTALQNAGPDAMLADAGDATAALLDASMNSGGRALRVGREAVDTRAAQAGAELGGKLDGILGTTQGRREAQRRIAQRTAPARKAAYDRAYASPIDYASDAGRNVEDVLARVPSSTMNRAIREANEAMQAAGVRNRQIMAEIADDGTVTFKEMPNVQQLDEIRKALSQIAQDETDAVTGKITGAGRRASGLARDLNEAIGEAAPAYKRATRIGGDKIREENAFNTGARLFSGSTTLEDVTEAVADGSMTSRAAAAAGLRNQIEERLSNVRRTITDGSTDAREAMQLVKDISSRANKAKVRALVGGKKADELFAMIDEALPALELRAAVAGNSKTAIRQAIQGQVKEEVAPGFLRKVASEAGNPLDAAKAVTQAVTRSGDKVLSDAEREIYAEIADALVGKRGQAAQQALRTVRRAMNGQPINDAQARQVGKVTGALVFSGGYRPTQERLVR